MTPDHELPDTDATRELARVLHSEVEHLEVSGDSLARIQARTDAIGTGTPWRWITPLAAAAVVALVASGVVLAPRGGDRTAGPPTSSTLPTPTVTPSVTPSSRPSPAPSPSTGRTPHPTATGAGSGLVATGNPPATSGPSCVDKGQAGYAYVASDLNGEGPRLYRIKIRLGCFLGVGQAMLVPPGKDPDYASLWPSGSEPLSLSLADSIATVDLSDFPVTTPEAETAAVQQIVYTLTANRPSVSAVRILVDGKTPVGNFVWDKPVHRASALTTLSNVWIFTPHHGATVGSPVSIKVYGTGYEGQVPIKVFTTDGVEVASTAVTTRMGGFAEASTTVDLPPGAYEIRAYNDNGQDASLELWDTKLFTVR